MISAVPVISFMNLISWLYVDLIPSVRLISAYMNPLQAPFPAATDSLGAGTYVHHGLGAQIRDGNWHTLQRDLKSDLEEAQPENELQAVLGFLIRGSGRVDDIKTRKAVSVE